MPLLPAAEASSTLWRQFYAAAGVDTTGSLYQNTVNPFTLALVTSIDVVNNAGSEGDGFILTNNIGGASFHSGFRGAGQADAFPWRGLLVLPYEDGVGIDVTGGQWSILINGFYAPDLYAVTL